MAVGKRKKQAALFDVGNVWDLELAPGSFHAQLAQLGPQLFRDEDFRDLYRSETQGRPSVPPSQMALLLLLQYHAGVSDEEALDRSAYDLRWAAVLRRSAGTPLCARPTLILFRSRLVLHNATERLFDRVLQQARDQGLLKSAGLRVILDTRPVVGRGAVEDTYNLIARSLDRVLRALADRAGEPVADWAARHDFTRYVRQREQSAKGAAAIDWTDPSVRQRYLQQLVGAARRALTLAAPALAPPLPPEGLAAEVALLTQILAQDVEAVPDPPTPPPGNPSSAPPPSAGAAGTGSPEPRVRLRDGTEKDRRPSATDPDQRHGHKSASRKFTGHKARVAVDAESQFILDVEVLAGNAGDAAAALGQVETLETRLAVTVSSTCGDCAFGGGETRQAFADTGRVLHAKVPAPVRDGRQIPKSAFVLLWEGEAVVGVRCPNGQTARSYRDSKQGVRTFSFGAACARCPLRWNCRAGHGPRQVQVHPQEGLLQSAREFQATDAGREVFGKRVVVEHALARLARYGAGQARYFGRTKTRLQLLLTATVVNFRWLANQGGKPETRGETVSSRPHPAFRPAWWYRLYPDVWLRTNLGAQPERRIPTGWAVPAATY